VLYASATDDLKWTYCICVGRRVLLPQRGILLVKGVTHWNRLTRSNLLLLLPRHHRNLLPLLLRSHSIRLSNLHSFCIHHLHRRHLSPTSARLRPGRVAAGSDSHLWMVTRRAHRCDRRRCPRISMSRVRLVRRNPERIHQFWRQDLDCTAAERRIAHRGAERSDRDSWPNSNAHTELCAFWRRLVPGWQRYSARHVSHTIRLLGMLLCAPQRLWRRHR
jgi:hypothetical protein